MHENLQILLWRPLVINLAFGQKKQCQVAWNILLPKDFCIAKK